MRTTTSNVLYSCASDKIIITQTNGNALNNRTDFGPLPSSQHTNTKYTHTYTYKYIYIYYDDNNDNNYSFIS